MNLNDICNLPVCNIADVNCVLFMWWVASMPYEALKVVEMWGFILKTMTGFSWIKTTKNNKPFFGMGFWTIQGLENCLIAVRGKPKRLDASIRAVFDFEVLEESFEFPIMKHSKKPDIVRDKIIDLMGDVPRIELFAREKVAGWDV